MGRLRNPLNSDEMHPYWEGLADRVQGLKQLDLSIQDNLEQALEESQRLLGAIAHCRHLLVQVQTGNEGPQRRAA